MYNHCVLCARVLYTIYFPHRGKWEEHHPYTNVLWINYIATKMSIKAKLKGPSSKSWKQKLEPYVKKILRHRTVKDVFLNIFTPERIMKRPDVRKPIRSNSV